MDFYEAWEFLNHQPMFYMNFAYDLWIDVVKVNPETNAIDIDKDKNTKVQVWLEHGEYDSEYHSCGHDIDLDCGGDTFEEAIIELARLVKENYTDDGEKIIK